MSDHPGFFDATAMPDAGWWTALWPDPGAVLTEVGLSAGIDAVDLCCGDGWFTLPMAELAAHVLAIDIDVALLNIARARLRDAGVQNCTLIAGDAFAIADFVSGPVDFVFLANVFHGAPDKAGLATAITGVLKPGGRFAIVNWHRRPREETPVLGEPRGPRTELRMTPDEVVATVAPAGLQPAYVVELPPYHYGAVFTR